MRNVTKIIFLLIAGFTVLTGLYSCEKTTNYNHDQNTSAAITAASAIQVAAPSTTTLSIATNSGSVVTIPVFTSGIYIVNCYPPGAKTDSVTFASLPDTIGKYLSINYTGYTFQKAFTITLANNTPGGYVVVINFNGKPFGLKFDVSGNFVAALEQREGSDLSGKGWHEGGCFANRDGSYLDTLALGTLPTSIKTYFATNYPADTLLHAVVNFDATYIVISTDNGLFATTFTSGGTLIKRIQIYLQPAHHAVLTQSGLPANITAYLATTFAGYVFDKAITEIRGHVLQGYFVFININNTRLAVQFDATGNFIKTTVLR